MKNFKKMCSKAKAKVAIMTTSACISLQGIVYADAASVASNGVNIAFNVVAVIPGVMGVLAVVNAATAYSQSQQEGGAQAASKMSNNILAAIVCFIIAAAVKAVLQPMVMDMMSLN